MPRKYRDLSLLTVITMLAATSLSTSAMAQDRSEAAGEEGTRWLTDKMSTAPQDDLEEHDPFAGSHIALRAWGGNLSLPSFEDGDEEERVRALHTRLRAGVRWEPLPERFSLHAESDFLAGAVTSSPDPSTNIPDPIKSGTHDSRGAYDELLEGAIDPRSLHLSYTSRVGLLRAGLQASTWGLGMIANSGARDNDQLFGQKFGGDRSARVLFATTPLGGVEASWAKKVFFGVGGDLVWRDENASFLRGDRAYQGVMSLFYRDDDRMHGVYGALRRQEDANGARLDVAALDAAFSREWSGEQWEIAAGGEVATLRGSTTRALPTTAIAEEVRVEGLGAALEFEATHRLSEIGAHLLAGYASGDANPDDETQYRFRFDPNYKVGLILFDSYIPSMTRAWYGGVTDPGNSAEPPEGVEQLISDGGIENSYYLNPQLTFGDPNELLAGVGVLRAWSDEPIAAPLQTFENGGKPTNVRGGTDLSRDLGWEIDLALQYRRSLVSRLTLELKGEVGILFPGEAFLDEQGESAPAESMARGRISLQW